MAPSAVGLSEAKAELISGGQRDDAALPGCRLGGILDQVEKQLDQEIAIAQHGGQGRIVVADETPTVRETRLGKPAHMVEHAMNIDRHAIERALIGEHLHPVDERHDPIHLFADEAGEAAPGLIQTRLKKLGCTAHAGERILHLMGEHRGQGSHGPRGTPTVERLVQPPGDRSLLEGDGHPVRPLRQGREIDRDQASAKGGTRDRHFPIGDIGTLRSGLPEQREQGAVRRKEIRQRPAERCHAQELSGGGIGIANAIFTVDSQDRHRQRLQQLAGIDTGDGGKDERWRPRRHHAARRSISGR